MDYHLISQLTIAALAGCGAALLYFTGLWLTVRRISYERRALLYLAISAVIRLGFILAAVVLALLAGADARHLIAALAGFLIVRQIMIMRVRTGLSGSARTPKI